jgi:hypothetical protein
MARPTNQEIQSQRTLSHLFETGIPVDKTVFKQAVDNGNNIPQNFFSADSNNLEKQVPMRITPVGIVCFHKGKYIRVPDSNTIFSVGK